MRTFRFYSKSLSLSKSNILRFPVGLELFAGLEQNEAKWSQTGPNYQMGPNMGNPDQMGPNLGNQGPMGVKWGQTGPNGVAILVLVGDHPWVGG